MTEQKIRLENLKGKLIVIESPFSGENERIFQANLIYARLCMFVVLKYGGIPIVPHLMWTQNLIGNRLFVQDNEREQGKLYDVGIQREQALDNICRIRKSSDLVVFCLPKNSKISSGMKHGIDQCLKDNIPYGFLNCTRKELMKLLNLTELDDGTTIIKMNK